MAEPTVGAFGATVLVAVLGLRVAAFAALVPDVVLVVLVWATSRAAMAWAIARHPYARPGGLGETFRGGSWFPAVLALAIALAVAAGGAPNRIAAVAACWVAAHAVIALGRRRLGGWTGDVLGAAGVVGETAALVVAATRW